VCRITGFGGIGPLLKRKEVNEGRTEQYFFVVLEVWKDRFFVLNRRLIWKSTKEDIYLNSGGSIVG
jgi:hypothetical protein